MSLGSHLLGLAVRGEGDHPVSGTSRPPGQQEAELALDSLGAELQDLGSQHPLVGERWGAGGSRPGKREWDFHAQSREQIILA